MRVDTRLSWHMCVFLLIDLIDGCQNNKNHPRKLSSGDERTLRRTFDKLQEDTSLFTSKWIQEGEHLNHVDLHLSSAQQRLLKNVKFVLITILSCKMGIYVKHSGCKKCLGITWMWNVLRCLFSTLPKPPGLNPIENIFHLIP